MAQVTVSVNGGSVKDWIDREVNAEVSKLYRTEVKGFRSSCKSESAVSNRDIRLAKELAAWHKANASLRMVA